MNSPSLDALIDQAWAEHAEAPKAVAERLAAAQPRLQSADDIKAWVGVWVHVLADHLGRWQYARAALQALRAHPGAADGATATLLERQAAALSHCLGDTATIAALPVADRCAALASAAPMLAGQARFDEAIAAYDAALQLQQPGWPDDAAAVRALAAGGNNLAEYLEEHAGRSAAQTRGMLRAAEGALAAWKRCGNWMNDERAEFRFAMSLLLAGQGGAAVQHAQRCAAICQEHDAPFEAFFAHAVLARAQSAAGDLASALAARERAQAVFAALAPEDQVWCRDQLAALAALGPR